MSAHNRNRRAAAVDEPTAPTRRPRWPVLVVVLAVGGLVALLPERAGPAPPAGMAFIPAGEFQMGTAGETKLRNETPAHRVRVRSFFLDRHEVTNAQFREFVAATGYVTVAEKPPDWEEMRKTLPPGTPKPPADSLVPGGLVFAPPAGPVPTDDASAWWKWTPGADWRHPEGPASDIAGKDDHPVVQVAWEDAVAYATWAGKRLPTEAEWEYAARGGLSGTRFEWGDEPPGEGGSRANIWQGRFPDQNTAADGFPRTAPVGRFPANGFGLHDMAGNVWEWCSDWYRADAYEGRRGVTDNPRGPTTFHDPAEPLVPKRVTRGGSFLCHASYCESYRPAARRGTATDSGLSHLGFRCAKDAE